MFKNSNRRKTNVRAVQFQQIYQWNSTVITLDAMGATWAFLLRDLRAAVCCGTSAELWLTKGVEELSHNWENDFS